MNTIIDNSNYFEVKTTKEQTFVIKEYDNKYNYTFELINNNIPCFLILIPKNRDIASLQSVLYSPDFSKENEIKHMLQLGLKYVIQKYPHIKKIHILDTVYYELDNTNISVITPRYLLTGQKGYYEQLLNAFPTKHTIEIIKTINENMGEIRKKIPRHVENDWWTPKNIYKITDLIRPDILSPKIFTTDWEVSKDIIDTYDVDWKIKSIEKPFNGRAEGPSPESETVKYMKKVLRFQKV